MRAKMSSNIVFKSNVCFCTSAVATIASFATIQYVMEYAFELFKVFAPKECISRIFLNKCSKNRCNATIFELDYFNWFFYENDWKWLKMIFELVLSHSWIFFHTTTQFYTPIDASNGIIFCNKNSFRPFSHFPCTFIALFHFLIRITHESKTENILMSPSLQSRD